MNKENKQIEDVIIAEAIRKLLIALAVLTIIGLIVSVVLLAASKRDAEYNLWKYKNYSDSINNANIENHRLDSITISKMPPVEYLDFLKQLNN